MKAKFVVTYDSPTRQMRVQIMQDNLFIGSMWGHIHYSDGLFRVYDFSRGYYVGSMAEEYIEWKE